MPFSATKWYRCWCYSIDALNFINGIGRSLRIALASSSSSSRQNAVSSPPRRLRLRKLIQMVGKNQGNGNAFFLSRRRLLMIQVVDDLFFQNFLTIFSLVLAHNIQDKNQRNFSNFWRWFSYCFGNEKTQFFQYDLLLMPSIKVAFMMQMHSGGG